MQNKSWCLMPAFGKRNGAWETSISQHKTKNEPPISCEKAVMVAYGKYLYVFGGYGPAPEEYKNYPVKPVFELDQSSSWNHPQGWNSNVYRYCVETENWEWVKCRGQQPTPRAG